MKQSIYNNYDELPLFLNADLVAKVLGASISSAYELMREEGFPALLVDRCIIVPKEKFCRWLEEQTSGFAGLPSALQKMKEKQDIFLLCNSRNQSDFQ